MDLIFKNRPETIVEIGVFGGKSLVPMAFALKGNKKGKIYGIDPWSNQASIEHVQNEVNRHWWGTLNLEAIRLGLVSQITRFGLDPYVELIQKTSADTPPIPNIDMLHIDGNHSDPTSYFDVIKWVPLVKSGGWIIFDDMTWYENGTYTTARAVAWLDEHCLKFGEFKDGCVWGIWVKP
jgi:predicted O-methyltransferase YrrM